MGGQGTFTTRIGMRMKSPHIIMLLPKWHTVYGRVCWLDCTAKISVTQRNAS